jgi:transcriptional regulator with XRE-family HTH domain
MIQKVSLEDGALLTVAQLRAARGLLGWSQATLAEASGLSLPTIKRTELETVNVSTDAREKMRRALESAGVIFVEENGEGPGVRLRKAGAPGAKPASIPLEDLNAENDE